MRISSMLIMVVAALAVSIMAACQSAPAAGLEQAQIADVPPTVGSVDDAYTLGNGDRLRVTVFGEPELSGEYLVDGTGLVSLPLVGEIPALGTTVRSFQQEVERQLVEKELLVSPRVSAEVINFRPYYILGEVGRPGEYPYTDALTVMNAVATAEGFTYRANRRTVFIRGVNETEERSVRLSPTLRVQPGDTIRIGERIF
ncbi:MAG: polysaccharide biosynthesis/export family protein [Pseudomonadota bacterium]